MPAHLARASHIWIVKMLAHPDLGFRESETDLLDTGLYASCGLPLGSATPLPKPAYVSEAFQRLENEKIWTRDWVCVGTTLEIPGVGDLLPYTIGQHAVHVQRVPSGKIVGRFNKAQHGGCRTIPAQCRTGRKTKCSYTSCGYSRDRQVISGLDPDDISPLTWQYLGSDPERLLPVDVAVVSPFIFANLDPTGGVKPALPVPPACDDLERHGGLWREYQANWKLMGAAIVASALECAAEHGCGEAYVQAEWFVPNLILIRSTTATLVLLLQPTAMDSTLCRISQLSKLGVSEKAGNFDELIEAIDAAGHIAALRQTSITNSDKDECMNVGPSEWRFNQWFVHRILQQHPAYWNEPLIYA
jgi:hypothetical protein